MAKKGCFWPFCLNSSSSTVTISLLVLQNVRCYHPEQYLQTWRAHRCLRGLIIAKNGPKMVKNGWFWPYCLDSSSSTVTTSLPELQNVSYYHTEQFLQTWSAHRCLKGLLIAKWPKNGWFWPSCLDSSSSTVTTSLLALQNVNYYHTEHNLQTWSVYNSKNWLKHSQKRLVLVVLFGFFLINCNHKSFSMAKCLLSSNFATLKNL